MITKESLVDLQEKYEKVKKLIEEDARFDPETQPYFSKYQARQHLISMNELLKNLIAKEKSGGEPQKLHKLIGMHGAVQLTLGTIAVETEELSIGEKHLDEALNIITEYDELPEVASVTLNLYNQLGILGAKRELEKGQEYLEKANKFYQLIKEKQIIPLDLNDIFIVNYELDEEAAMKKFEKLYTFTLFYLAQVYRTVDPLKSAVYCHRTLQRQLESGEYEQIDWILNTATLSQFLMEKNGFKQARHYLSASLYMLDEHKKALDAVEEHNDEYDAKLETYRHRYADVARCRGKYGLMLLSNSKDRLLADNDILVTLCQSTDIAEIKLDEASTVNKNDLKNMYFPTLDLAEYEETMSDKFVLMIDDAKQVFLSAQKWFIKAQEYYAIDSLASDYIEIAQDLSKLYDMLVFFEENPENRTKLLKRAADILEKVLKEVNPTYYMQYCRQCWFRLGIIYSDMLDLKLDKLKEQKNRPTPHAVQKINTLVEKSATHFTTFIDSCKNSKGEMPDKIGDEVEKPFLQANFHLAALQTRIITLNKAISLKNTEKSVEYYAKVVDYCKRNERAAEVFNDELSVAKEMVQLLPLKIIKLRKEITADDLVGAGAQ